MYFFIYFFILFIYLFIYFFFIIIFRYAIAYLRTGSYAPVLVHLYLKIEKCMRRKLLVQKELSFILRICEQNSSVIVRFEIMLWLHGPEKFPGLSRNRPLIQYQVIKLCFSSK